MILGRFNHDVKLSSVLVCNHVLSSIDVVHDGLLERTDWFFRHLLELLLVLFNVLLFELFQWVFEPGGHLVQVLFFLFFNLGQDPWRTLLQWLILLTGLWLVFCVDLYRLLLDALFGQILLHNLIHVAHLEV